MASIKAQTGGDMGANDETASRGMLAGDMNRAAYFWMVMDPTMTTTLIAEYDTPGLLHKLSEIVMPPPYMWCAQSYRAPLGVVNRNILIPVGYEPIWANRVRVAGGIAQGCLMFGRRNIATRAEEVLLLYPDGTSFQLTSMSDAIAH